MATFVQRLSDAATVRRLGVAEVERRYLVYAPAALPARPVPVVFVFPGYSASAEGAAFYYTHTRWEALADRDGFVVVYGNGLPHPPDARERPAMPKGGFLQGCLAEHAGEGIDVAYVRHIVEQLESTRARSNANLRDRAVGRRRHGVRARAGGSGSGRGHRPRRAAAVSTHGALAARVHSRPGHERVSIAMLAATDDPFISYAPGSSREYPAARYPGMEETRAAWLAALGIAGAPRIDVFPDVVQGDSFQPQTGRASSTIERQRFGPAADGRELWFYKAVGMGHCWPNPIQTWSGLWQRFGKTNQDIDFTDEAWAFFQRPRAAPRAPPGSRFSASGRVVTCGGVSIVSGAGARIVPHDVPAAPSTTSAVAIQRPNAGRRVDDAGVAPPAPPSR